MSKNKFKSKGRLGLFDRETTSLKLSKIGNILEKLDKVIDFEMFREELEKGMLNNNKKNNSGCKPYYVVIMFKIIVIKCLNDEQVEYQISDRLSFKKYLKLSSGDRVPEARTIWLFQNKLIEKQLE